MKKRATRNSMQADPRNEKPTRKSVRKKLSSGGNGRNTDPEPVPKKRKVLERKDPEEPEAPESDNSTVEAPVNVPVRYGNPVAERKKSVANRNGGIQDRQISIDEQLDMTGTDVADSTADNENGASHDDREEEKTVGTRGNKSDGNKNAAESGGALHKSTSERTSAEERERHGGEEKDRSNQEDVERGNNSRSNDHRDSPVREPITYFDEDGIMVEHRDDGHTMGNKWPNRSNSAGGRVAGSVPESRRESRISGRRVGHIGHESESETRRAAVSAQIAERRKKYMSFRNQPSNSSAHSRTAEVRDITSPQLSGSPRSPLQCSGIDSQNDSRLSIGSGSSGQNEDCDDSDDDEDEDSPSKSLGKKKKKSRKQGETYRKKYLAIMKEQCSGIDKVITKKSVPSAIASSMIDTIYFQILIKSPMSSAVLQDMFKFMLFGKQKKAKKADCFSSQIGELGTLFRKKVMKNFALHLRKGFVPDAWLGIKYKELCSRPECIWVLDIVPSDAICEMVSKVREKKGFSKTRNGTISAIGLKRRDVNVTDKTEFVLNHTYTTVVSALNVNRKTFKRMFFGRIGYLLTKWTDVDFYTVRQDVTGMWLEAHDIRNFLRPQDVPNTKTLKDEGNIDVENMELFERVTEERTELMLSVQHDVKLKVSKPLNSSKSNAAFASGPSNEDLSYQSFRRTFSLLGVALRMLSDLCGVPSEKKEFYVLKYHSKSLAVCYCLAIALKQIMLSCSDEVSIGEPLNDRNRHTDDDDGLGPSEQAECGNDSEDEDAQRFEHEVHEDMFRMLAIPRGEAKGILERSVGSVLESFWRKNHTGSNGQDEDAALMGRGVEPETGVDVGDVDPDSLKLDM